MQKSWRKAAKDFYEKAFLRLCNRVPSMATCTQFGIQDDVSNRPPSVYGGLLRVSFLCLPAAFITKIMTSFCWTDSVYVISSQVKINRLCVRSNHSQGNCQRFPSIAPPTADSSRRLAIRNTSSSAYSTISPRSKCS